MTPDDIREVLLPVHQRLVRLSFGKQWGNPFMKVITPENCATLRVPTYFDFVKVFYFLNNRMCRIYS